MMVIQIKPRGETYYLCPACRLAYREREWAQRCEDFCTKYKGCSIEITRHAVTLREGLSPEE